VKLEPGQIAIVFTPVVEDDEWTGAIHTGILFGDEKHKFAMRHSMDMAVTMAATHNFLDDNPEFLEDFVYYKEAILKDMFPESYEAALKEEREKDGYIEDDNVIILNRWTKTEGNA
jgi:hypothetical protein